LIREGITLVEEALSTGHLGPYTLQAAVAAVHAEAPTVAETDWAEIVAIYNLMLQVDPSPVIQLNRAVAVAMRDGPAIGLKLMDAVNRFGDLDDYQWFYSARADLLRRLGRRQEAEEFYRKALKMTQLEPEQRFLEKRIQECRISPCSND
jgi:RNA polymerase sigma-70 factor (ECF subfamily)